MCLQKTGVCLGGGASTRGGLPRGCTTVADGNNNGPLKKVTCKQDLNRSRVPKWVIVEERFYLTRHTLWVNAASVSLFPDRYRHRRRYRGTLRASPARPADSTQIPANTRMRLKIPSWVTVTLEKYRVLSLSAGKTSIGITWENGVKNPWKITVILSTRSLTLRQYLKQRLTFNVDVNTNASWKQGSILTDLKRYRH